MKTRCFACNRLLPSSAYCEAYTSDGQRVWIGPDCFKRIKSAKAKGYQPPKGGPRPRLYLESYLGEAMGKEREKHEEKQ